MKALQYLRVAFGGIQVHRLRAILTTLGIMIGIAAVLVTVGIGSGSARLFNAPRYRGSYTITSMSVQVVSQERLDAAALQVEQVLRLRHGLGGKDENDFSLQNQADLLEMASDIAGTLTTLLGGIGAISLVVGGIGIMNITLVSVTERTKETGLRINDLLNSPMPAEIAAAQAQVAEAEATLADLQSGPTADEIRSAQIKLEEALINLEAATVTAPMAGVVTALSVEQGVRSAADSIVVMLADPTQLELVISVADALPGQTYTGVVETIAPTNDSDTTAVSYPVTIRLTAGDLAAVLPGMNAVATLVEGASVSAESWLAPTNALVAQADGTTVTVVRGDGTMTVSVTPGTVQGEWTICGLAILCRRLQGPAQRRRQHGCADCHGHDRGLCLQRGRPDRPELGDQCARRPRLL